MPAWHSGTSSRSRRAIARAAASASSSALSRSIGRTEDRQRRVALELVDQPVVAVDLLDDDREEAVQQLDHLRRRAGWSPAASSR